MALSVTGEAASELMHALMCITFPVKPSRPIRLCQYIVDFINVKHLDK